MKKSKPEKCYKYLKYEEPLNYRKLFKYLRPHPFPVYYSAQLTSLLSLTFLT